MWVQSRNARNVWSKIERRELIRSNSLVYQFSLIKTGGKPNRNFPVNSIPDPGPEIQPVAELLT